MYLHIMLLHIKEAVWPMTWKKEFIAFYLQETVDIRTLQDKSFHYLPHLQFLFGIHTYIVELHKINNVLAAFYIRQRTENFYRPSRNYIIYDTFWPHAKYLIKFYQWYNKNEGIFCPLRDYIMNVNGGWIVLLWSAAGLIRITLYCSHTRQKSISFI